MNPVVPVSMKARRFVDRMLAVALVVAGAGGVNVPAVAATVPVDQVPLIIQRSLPPNLVLMLDDSGSMAWDYMPDWGYLSDTSADGVRNASINGVYYASTSRYLPPPKADGTFYPDSPGIVDAYADGFRDLTSTDVTSYSSDSQSFNYFERLKTTVFRKYNAFYDRYNGYSCYSGDGSPSSRVCSSYYANFFTYTTGDMSPYTRHYVGSAGYCATVVDKAQAANCVDTAAERQNVANWFSYYRTRLLMAKSGLMNSFATVDKSFRIGFGSINGNNDSNLSSSGGTTTKFNSVKIGQVAPFGDGSSGTQKAKFWSWVDSSKANSSTPLQNALDAVGKYYQSDQPWSGMSSDPDAGTAAGARELACRQSYTILTTDGFWNGSVPDGIGDQDSVSGKEISGENGQKFTYKPVLPYADLAASGTYVGKEKNSTACQQTYKSITGSSSGWKSSYYSGGTCKFDYAGTSGIADTLADVAMKYWKLDLRPDTKNEVPTNSEDPAFWQHMTTFTLGMGFSPLYSDQKTPIPMDQVFAWANGDASKAISGFSWPVPSKDSINNIADLAHAAVNGHGGFFSAKNPKDFSDSLKEALKRASERVGTGASLAANSTQLKTGTVAYQANYWTAKWKGDLKALAIDSTTGVIATSPTWVASNKLPTAASRKIKTYNPAAASGSRYVDFAWANLSTTQQTALAAVPSLPSDGAQVVAYLRGDSSLEASKGGTFRNRDTPVGDIVNSQPVYVGAPNPNQFYTESFSGSSAFSQFASDKAARVETIYVSANDGMLHGFDATSGAEKFAYLPGAVITSGISALASPEYGGSVPHGFFNDGELTVADAYTGSTPKWKSILVGTTGRGIAKTVYALDVTDPADVNLLWERSAGDGLANSNYIGQMTGKPVIAQTANGKWAVLMGNGYNSTAGVSALLQFELDDGTLHVHKTPDTTGLAAPAVWMNPSGNGVSTIAYAGDGSGNVWSFGLNTSAGTVAAATPDSDGVKIYMAKDAANKAQPITAGMLIGKDPATGNTWVFFGTGRYLSTSDLANTDTQTWYGLIVQSGGASDTAVTSAMTRSANLAKRAITAEAGNGRAVTTIGEAEAAGTSIAGKSGWYMDLTKPVDQKEGERMVTPSQFQGNMLIGTTRIPLASDPCNPSGRGWIMALNPFTGTNPTASFFDINGDGKVDSGDTVDGKPAAGIGFTSLPNNPIFVGSTMLTSFDNGTTSSTKTSSSTGDLRRVSWRELIAH